MRPSLRGTLRDHGLYGQSLRFVLAGGVVAATYLVATTLLSRVAHLPFQAALAIGMALAVSLHFTLQRFFVWRRQEAYALRLRHQLLRYLVVAACQYSITALVTAYVPAAIGVPVLVVYLVTAVLLTLSNFVVFRRGVFHASVG